MIVEWEDRKIDIELGNATPDHDYWCDCFIERGYYEDTGEEVPVGVLDAMQNSGNMDNWIIQWVY